ncbi:MAG: glycosyltransferase family A protein, partial [Chitinophagaceae bacterium]
MSITANPLVSVIMPAYNAEKHIAESIQCVIDQDYPDWELLVVDDGSSDKTATIIQHFADKDSRIKYIYQQNGRQGKARNNGLRHARGEYIAFLDADDLWIPDKLSIQVAIMQSRNVDLLYADYFYFRDQPGQGQALNLASGSFYGPENFEYYLATNRVGILTVMVKKQLVDAVGGFTEDPAIQNAEDLHLWQKLYLAGGRFESLKQQLAYYRAVPDSSSSADRQVIFEALAGMKDLETRFPQHTAAIVASFAKRINNYLAHSNVRNKKFLRLLKIRRQVCSGGLPDFVLSTVHRIFGMRVGRYLFMINLR